ncbi:uncharacterized protein LY79DRAFT_101799 [Colletotrichum navitas]|uniref:Uncharacterized protein n=1 Tax=Colletotrichum navitas TaxID=681940 RepID=A0AAD8Q4T1_9PEZI|nr:uncharacterized protein LY79DRAFT_101799 [Colletotrichum navitas]KAK1595569.1 hypothetical protein LY79DRAFT_101799 [Colletotrichum navitas]
MSWTESFAWYERNGSIAGGLVSYVRSLWRFVGASRRFVSRGADKRGRLGNSSVVWGKKVSLSRLDLDFGRGWGVSKEEVEEGTPALELSKAAAGSGGTAAGCDCRRRCRRYRGGMERAYKKGHRQDPSVMMSVEYAGRKGNLEREKLAGLLQSVGLGLTVIRSQGKWAAAVVRRSCRSFASCLWAPCLSFSSRRQQRNGIGIPIQVPGYSAVGETP